MIFHSLESQWIFPKDISLLFAQFLAISSYLSLFHAYSNPRNSLRSSRIGVILLKINKNFSLELNKINIELKILILKLNQETKQSIHVGPRKNEDSGNESG